MLLTLSGPQAHRSKIVAALSSAVRNNAQGDPDDYDWGFDLEGDAHTFLTVEAENADAIQPTLDEFGWRVRAQHAAIEMPGTETLTVAERLALIGLSADDLRALIKGN